MSLLFLAICNREINGKGCAFVNRAFNLQNATVSCDCTLNHGQSQSCAVRLGRVKWIKNLLQLIVRNPTSVVRDLYLDAVGVARKRKSRSIGLASASPIGTAG
jgi:hypothetical protein